jgi:hypothetical protein
MGWENMFRPYSPEQHGELEAYLLERYENDVDNLFRGEQPFFAMKERGLLVCNTSVLRIDRSPIPDLLYVVNENYLLESRGEGNQNMSATGAPAGVYDPVSVLREKNWSIQGVRFTHEQRE